MSCKKHEKELKRRAKKRLKAERADRPLVVLPEVQLPPTVMVPCRPIMGANLLRCSENVLMKIRHDGGRQVFGWTVQRHFGAVAYLNNHCVWEDEEGQLWDVTPKLLAVEGDLLLGGLDEEEETEFFRDDAATFDLSKERSRLGRYVPLTSNKHLKRACDYMTKSDEAMHGGDLAGCRFWTIEANREMKAGGFRFGWAIPASLKKSDMLAASLGD